MELIPITIRETICLYSHGGGYMAIDSINNSGAFDQSLTRTSAVEGKSIVQEDKIEKDNNSKTVDKKNTEVLSQAEAEKKVKAAIEEANSKLKHTNTKCEFGVHEATNRITIKIIDKDTDELIREVPPEKTLEMIEKVWEIAGLLVDEKI